RRGAAAVRRGGAVSGAAEERQGAGEGEGGLGGVFRWSAARIAAFVSLRGAPCRERPPCRSGAAHAGTARRPFPTGNQGRRAHAPEKQKRRSSPHSTEKQAVTSAAPPPAAGPRSRTARGPCPPAASPP